MCHLSKSTDGGKSWACLLTMPDTSALLIDPAQTSNLYLVSSSGQLYASRDGGAAWEPAARGLTGPIISLAVDPRQPLTFYASVISTGVFRSTDGGLHWDRFDAGLPRGDFIGGFRFDPVQPSIIYTVTDGEGVYMLDTGQP